MIPPNKPRRFKGIKLPPGYEEVLRDAVQQDLKDPEDQFDPSVPNELQKKWGGNFNG